MKSSSTRRPGIGAASRPKAGARPAGRSSAVPGSRSAADVASPGARSTPRGETAMRRTRAGSRTGEARTARGAAAKSLAGQAAPGPAAAVRPTGREGLRQMMSGNAARRLGMIANDSAKVSAATCGPWKRLSTARGQVFIYSTGPAARLALHVVR